MSATALDISLANGHIQAIQDAMNQANHILNEMRSAEQEAQEKSTTLKWLEQIATGTVQTTESCQTILATIEELRNALAAFNAQLEDFANQGISM